MYSHLFICQFLAFPFSLLFRPPSPHLHIARKYFNQLVICNLHFIVSNIDDVVRVNTGVVVAGTKVKPFQHIIPRCACSVKNYSAGELIFLKSSCHQILSQKKTKQSTADNEVKKRNDFHKSNRILFAEEMYTLTVRKVKFPFPSH